MRIVLIFIIFYFNSYVVFAQTSARQIAAVRATSSIKIDGELNDEGWKTAAHTSGFVEQRPTFNKPEDEKNKTDVFLLYDDNAIYFAGFFREQDNDSISKQLGGRDNIGINDFGGIVFDTYKDQINGLGFFVTPLNEQFDVKYSLGFEDLSWNSVYQTQTKITDQGWTFEMRIPYSAIRFSKEKVQTWGLQFFRRRAKTGQQFSWNPIDPTKFGFMNQAGLLTGITDIKSPLRLSFAPYFSTYLNHNPTATGKKWSTSLNGGMDLKYGISKGFTLDMTLIPDFGQVQSDNLVLNLTPFEVRYNEYRSFFTEATELFNKGNLFYSRRIGGTPMHYGSVYNKIGPNERIIKNPAETKLLNATKISGRTAKGLGIGFFNAITKAQFATVENDIKQQYEIETNPFTNYNVLVLDQTMKNNSSVTLVNTNVWRSGSDYDANVTAFLWDLYDNKVNWNIWGQATHSRLMGFEGPGKTLRGYHYNLYVGKFKGRLNFDVHRFFADENYTQRDMGYFTNNNYLDHGFWVWYKWVEPKSIYNNLYLNLRGTYSELYKPRRFQSIHLHTNLNGQLKNLWGFRISSDYRPERQDFYEPRISGKMVKLPGSWTAGIAIGTNAAKKYSVGIEAAYVTAPKYKSRTTIVELGNNYRFSDKLNIGLSHFFEFANRDLGFAFIATTGDSVIFGLRNRRTAENVFTTKYNFNNKMGLTFRARHYWSKVHYTRFFNLKDDGYVEDISSVNRNPDNNVNFFNIDMIYTWQFAPGSFLNVAWKDAAQGFDQLVNDRYYRNLRNTLDTPQQNTFSVKVIYYLDYLTLRTKGGR